MAATIAVIGFFLACAACVAVLYRALRNGAAEDRRHHAMLVGLVNSQDQPVVNLADAKARRMNHAPLYEQQVRR